MTTVLMVWTFLKTESSTAMSKTHMESGIAEETKPTSSKIEEAGFALFFDLGYMNVLKVSGE